MKNVVYYAIPVALAFSLCTSVFAYTVQGTVKDESGSAITGASVSLLKKGKSTKTDNDGKFTIHEDEAPDITTGLHQAQQGGGFISINQGVLNYSQSGNAPVQVKIFDIVGNVVANKTIYGSGTLDLREGISAKGTYFARVRVGSAMQNIKFTADGSFNSSTTSGTALYKAGDTDDLQVIADGFDTLNVALNNLDTTLALTLKKTAPAEPQEKQYAFGYALGNAPRPSQGCGKEPTLKGRGYSCEKGACDQTAQLFSINVGGKNRDYYASFPKNYDKNKPYRIIVANHCMGSSANHMATWDHRDRDHVSPFYDLRVRDTEETTIFLAPQGNSNGTWNGQEDHDFFKAMIDHMKDDYCIDTTRIFAAGFSFGAMFTNSLAQHYQTMLRAVAVFAVADYNIWLPANTGEPIAWMAVHGTQDGMCDYNKAVNSALPRILKNNGKASDGDSQFTDASSEKLPKYNGGPHVCYDFTSVDPRFPVKFCSHGADHQWSATDNSDNNKTWVSDEVWKFFGQF